MASMLIMQCASAAVCMGGCLRNSGFAPLCPNDRKVLHAFMMVVGEISWWAELPTYLSEMDPLLLNTLSTGGQ